MRKIEIKSKSLNYECDEAFKALRTNLQFCGEDKKVIMFTLSLIHISEPTRH